MTVREWFLEFGWEVVVNQAGTGYSANKCLAPGNYAFQGGGDLEKTMWSCALSDSYRIIGENDGTGSKSDARMMYCLKQCQRIDNWRWPL